MHDGRFISATRVLTVLVCGAMWMASSSARAQQGDAVTAESLFQAGWALMKQGKIAEAETYASEALKVMEAELDPSDTRLRDARELLTKIQEAERGQEAGTGP